MIIVSTPDAPEPNGHYSQAVIANGLVFLAAQLPIPPGGGGLAPDLASQARQVLENCRAILEGAGVGLSAVVSATVYLRDVAAWPAVNAIWAEAFGEHRPARGVVGVNDLHLGALIAIQMIASADNRRGEAIAWE